MGRRRRRYGDRPRFPVVLRQSQHLCAAIDVDVGRRRRHVGLSRHPEAELPV